MYRKKFTVYHENNSNKEIDVVDVLINNHFTFYIIREGKDYFSIVHEKGLYILQKILKKDIDAGIEFFESIIEFKKKTIGIDGINKLFTEAMEKNTLIKK